MKTYVHALLFACLLSATTFLWSMAPPQREEPTEICLPTHVENNNVCHCLAMNRGQDICKDGKLENETMSCNSFCKKDLCQCCATIKGKK